MTSENLFDYIRIGLYIVLAILIFFLFQAWTKDHPATVVAPTAQTETIPSDRYIPDTVAAPSAGTHTQSAASPRTQPTYASASELVKVNNDVMEVAIDLRGGDIVASKFYHYPVSLSDKQPFILLNDDAKTRYIAESGLLSKTGPDTGKGQALYKAEKNQYSLEQGAENLSVTLTWQNAEGVKVNKIFSFTRGSYEVDVSYSIANHSSQAWQGNLYTQLMRTNTPPAGNGGFVNLATFFGAAVSTPAKPFNKITFKDMQKNNLQEVVQNGWAAMVQHYFITAWVPPKDATSTYYTKVTSSGLYTVGMIGQPIVVNPGESQTVTSKLYTGPAIANKLEKTAQGLKLTIDYGWFWFFSEPIFKAMKIIHDFIGNWGWSIVIVTILIKLLFYPLSSKSYRSMSGIKKLQPRIEALKARFGDDRQKLTQATLDLYRQEKVNPMSGCLPILIQIPVFIALYWVLVESVELRQAPFILWIRDLSQPDPYYILPILMGLSMFLQQLLNPPPPDPVQAKVMMAMPLIFTILFANFPAGLMLYWFINNTLSFLQQWYIMRRINSSTK